MRGCRKLHNEELHNMYPSPVIRVIKSRRMRWVRHVACTGMLKNSYKILIGKPDGKMQFGRLRHRWEDNIENVC